jgi:hypothetical protein
LETARVTSPSTCARRGCGAPCSDCRRAAEDSAEREALLSGLDVLAADSPAQASPDL